MSSENINNNSQTVQKVKKDIKKKKFVNTSGQGPNAHVPQVIAKEFNWGAFLGNWIWGLFNKTYITLLILVAALIPIVNFIAPLALAIWFGIKGNTWAWQNKRFNDIRSFNQYQRKLTTIFLVLYIISIVISLIIFISAGAAMFSLMSSPQM